VEDIVLSEKEIASLLDELNQRMSKFRSVQSSPERRNVQEQRHPQISLSFLTLESISDIIKGRESVADISLPGGSEATLSLEPDLCEVLQAAVRRSGLKDPVIYKRANIPKQTYNKIINGQLITVGKENLFKIMLVIECDLQAAMKILEYNGLAFNPSSKFDQVIKLCFEKGYFNPMTVDQILDEADLPALFWK
jgi:hypothetical protein